MTWKEYVQKAVVAYEKYYPDTWRIGSSGTLHSVTGCLLSSFYDTECKLSIVSVLCRGIIFEG